MTSAAVLRLSTGGAPQDGYQKQYFVLESFAKGAQQLRDYCAKITPPEIMAQFMTPAA